MMLNDMLLISSRLSGATILDGTWKNIYSISNFRFYCNMKKRTGKHDMLCVFFFLKKNTSTQ
ncbi:hypothetical protein Peur_004226 [Populus x canadensis]